MGLLKSSESVILGKNSVNKGLQWTVEFEKGFATIIRIVVFKLLVGGAPGWHGG